MNLKYRKWDKKLFSHPQILYVLSLRYIFWSLFFTLIYMSIVLTFASCSSWIPWIS